MAVVAEGWALVMGACGNCWEGSVSSSSLKRHTGQVLCCERGGGWGQLGQIENSISYNHHRAHQMCLF